jgi:hypothetical protein
VLGAVAGGPGMRAWGRVWGAGGAVGAGQRGGWGQWWGRSSLSAWAM